MKKDNQINPQLDRSQKKTFIKLRRDFTKPVLGITGYLGKTTLIAMLSVVLGGRGRVLRTVNGTGSWENNLKTLAKLNSDYDFAIFEFDYQHGKNFAGLLRLIKPNIAVITNIGDAHLAYLKDAMQVALQKSEVVKYIARDGFAILNQDDDLSSSLSRHIKDAKVCKYGMNHNADFYVSDIEQLGPKGIKFKLNGEKEFTIPIYSVFNVYSFLACAATCYNLGIPVEETVKLIQQKFVLPKGRGNMLKINSFYLLDESYSGSSRAVSKAARTLVGFGPYTKKTVLIVGDMTDQGVKIEDRHLNMGHFLSALPIDYLITVGHYAKYIAQGAALIKTKSKKIISVDNVNELLTVLEEILKPNMAISVKSMGNVVFHRIKSLLEKL